MQLTDNELKQCAGLPGVLRALAEYHSVKETEADASDWPETAAFHEKRRKELSAEAARIEEDDQRN